MVKLRFKRIGRRHRNEFRLCVMDARSPRDGKTIEEIGTYHPQAKDDTKQFSYNAERVKYWLSVGAQPSETLHDLLAKAGVVAPLAHRKTAPKAKKGKK